MSDTNSNSEHYSIPDPATQHTEREDTSVVPDLGADPVEEEEKRIAGVDDDSDLPDRV
ncbi:hypothetical protein QWJ90_08595 [Microbacterium oryzae]|uniref:hypothetical protein n=1 Tax=Microbacterium oryzae TaxID=743009 RepID=UPI0025B080A8|nr:hypothetical protein [Microbacterium oryzae]MDN3310988.1 hypothetical protein [Microbacterium oryzae]